MKEEAKVVVKGAVKEAVKEARNNHRIAIL
jgi:hypothetical protein